MIHLEIFGDGAGMRIKICGITTIAQGCAIASLGATDLGFICVPSSPRYLTPSSIGEIVDSLPLSVNPVGVFVDCTIESIFATVAATGLKSVQLHGTESVEFCRQLRTALPECELIKATRVRNEADLKAIALYDTVVDTLLLDAYHPHMFGGTGQTLDWSQLIHFKPSLPWLLAGGLTPDNIITALNLLNPDGIDLSSGVEISPGVKDLDLVERLFSLLSTRENPPYPRLL